LEMEFFVMEIFHCEQGSDEWFAVRMGIPTASNFAAVLADGRGVAKDLVSSVKEGATSKTRQTYLYKLAGEIITGRQPSEGFSNVHTERGHAMENDARQFYAYMNDVEPRQVGFIRNGRKGCSPDALIDENGVLEIKTKLPHLMIETLLKGKFPSAHKAQCQGILWITEREWIDLFVYWPAIPPFIVRAERDENYICKLENAIDEFNRELDEVVSKIVAMNEFSS
jgi:hypothetical protein